MGVEDDKDEESTTSSAQVASDLRQQASVSHQENRPFLSILEGERSSEPSFRPTSSTDSRYMLNLLSGIPFIQDLGFTSTMELLELVRIRTFRAGWVVVRSGERGGVICVVWEGALVEGAAGARTGTRDWTGPIRFQPYRNQIGDGDAKRIYTKDIVVEVSMGVKASCRGDWGGYWMVYKVCYRAYYNATGRIGDQRYA